MSLFPTNRRKIEISEGNAMILRQSAPPWIKKQFGFDLYRAIYEKRQPALTSFPVPARKRNPVDSIVGQSPVTSSTGSLQFKNLA